MEKNNPDHTVLQANTRSLKVLIAPLDWGLGHTTRCIPLAHALLNRGVKVFFAGNARQNALLQPEFPTCSFLELEGYNIRYSKTARGLAWKLFTQLPALRKTIAAEHQWLLEQAKKYAFDAVISDNRFGLWHPFIPSIFITHQLTIKTPFAWAERLVQKINYRLINRFSACWVPDMPGEVNLAGLLSHPGHLPRIPVKYIGLLSRLQPLQRHKQPARLFISLSGPEPQRSLLETKIIAQLQQYTGTATIVRGLPASALLPAVPSQVNIFNHLDTTAYNEAMSGAGLVISRTGYSTVMDIITAGQKSILIPTPGQTEQEYLAQYLSASKLALCYPQHSFNLLSALETARSFDYRQPVLVPLHEKVIADFVSNLTPAS